MPIGLAWIFYKLVSVLTSIADEIVPIGLALINNYWKLMKFRIVQNCIPEKFAF